MDFISRLIQAQFKIAMKMLYQFIRRLQLMQYPYWLLGADAEYPFSQYFVQQNQHPFAQNVEGLQSLSEYQLRKKLRQLSAKRDYLERENITLKETINNQKQDQIKNINEEIFRQEKSAKIQQLSDSIIQLLPAYKKPSKRRRTSDMLEKNMVCPYQRCDRRYASGLALNLHIRVKHNGGTKKQRKQILKAVIEAQLCGTELPDINLNLPPNYIEKKRLLLGCQNFLKLGLVPSDIY